MSLCATCALLVAVFAAPVWAQSPTSGSTTTQPLITQPVFRVAEKSAPAPQTPVVDPAVTPAATSGEAGPMPEGLEGSPFDLRLRKDAQGRNEHPLMPCLRLAKEGLAEMDQNLRGYSGTMTKRERIGGKQAEPQQISLKIRHKPFSVHMKFIKPFAGREVLYNAGRNQGKLVALAHDWKRRFGKVKLDPNGSMAMNGQRYPITMTGIYNLTEELVKVASQDVKYGECTVRYSTQYKVDNRPCTMIEVTHPVPRKNFRFHLARIFIDHEMRIPVAYSAYSWPATAGGKPVLEEEYIYTNLKLNPGFTDIDFDETNPNLFR